MKISLSKIRQMKIAIKISLFFVMLCASPCFGQNYSDLISTASEETPDSVIFDHCLDSISKYVYLDSRKIKPYTSACEEMLTDSTELSNRHRLEYVIQRIYIEYNYDNTFGALEIIETNRKMLELEGIRPVLKNRFKYLQGYTLLLIGETESAQDCFYELLDFAKTNRDTSLMAQSVGSLGKLFGMQKDYENAEKYALEFLELIPDKKPVHKVNGYVELISLYLENESIDKAEYYSEIALKLADSLNLVEFQVELLLNSVSVNIHRENAKVALEKYRKAYDIAEKTGNRNSQKLCKQSYAEILVFQQRYSEALSVYEQFIEEGDEVDVVPSELLEYYQSASRVANLNGNFEIAFQYVRKANQIEDDLFVEEQKGKSQYLRIKFDAEQKEKDNILRTSQVMQKQFQNKILYGLILIFVIGTLFLIAAFLQKRKYNRLLESEVRNRTTDLESANKSLQTLNVELSEFNNILSHDLKEPLRNIVGFSQMAKRELSMLNGIPKERLVEYLDYINMGGKQLDTLIRDVSNFQSIEDVSTSELQLVDVNLVVTSVMESVKCLLEEKDAAVEYDDLPSVYSNETLLFLVFKNLIENGVKFNSSKSPSVRIQYEQANGFHIFHLKDNGIGIAPEFHDRVFGMFKRLHDRGTYEGSGLGLNIVAKIVRKLGGSIVIVESDVNKGSVFKMRLPIHTPSESSCDLKL